jgi:hypothetical protein
VPLARKLPSLIFCLLLGLDIGEGLSELGMTFDFVRSDLSAMPERLYSSSDQLLSGRFAFRRRFFRSFVDDVRRVSRVLPSQAVVPGRQRRQSMRVGVRLCSHASRRPRRLVSPSRRRCSARRGFGSPRLLWPLLSANEIAMASRRIISSEKTLLEMDEADARSPAASEPSSITPAVPTFVPLLFPASVAAG